MRTGLLGSPLVAVPIATATLIVGKTFCVLVNIDVLLGARRGAMPERKTSQRRLWLQVTQVHAYDRDTKLSTPRAIHRTNGSNIGKYATSGRRWTSATGSACCWRFRLRACSCACS